MRNNERNKETKIDKKTNKHKCHVKMSQKKILAYTLILLSYSLFVLAVSAADYGSRHLSTGEIWNLSNGYSITVNSIDAKATPKQAWLILSDYGIKVDDKVVKEGDIYNYTSSQGTAIFSTTIASIQAGTILLTNTYAERLALLNISPLPSNFTIYIDGIDRSKTSLSTTIEAGLHTITLKQIGYNDWSQTINLTSGQTYNISPRPDPMYISTPIPNAIPTSTTSNEGDEIVLGKLLFNPPKEMIVGEKERIEVRITKNLTENLTNGLVGSGEPQYENVKVSRYMTVRMFGNNFDIDQLSHEEQLILNEEYTQWDFDVTPIESGYQFLHLSVAIRLRTNDGYEISKDYPVLDRQIDVKVNPIENSIDNLTSDQIIFNIPQEMTVDVKEKVELGISKNIIGNIKPEMKLTGKNFDIEEWQEDSNNSYDRWIYYVTPTSSGYQDLALNIIIKLNYPHNLEKSLDKEFKKTINVKINLLDIITTFLKDNWKWIITTLFGSGIFWIIIKNKFKRSNEDGSNDDNDDDS